MPSMFDEKEYQMLDFGHGRRLERFGPFVLDRPCPGAEGASIEPSARGRWKNADIFFESTGHQRGKWASEGKLPRAWLLRTKAFTLELKPTEFGQIGVFPEQSENWGWIHKTVSQASKPLKVLNLFGYTGGSTLAAASAGAEVVHVDSAKTSVARARRNAEVSSLAAAPIRWIVEDAGKFVRRELKRGNTYDAVILDPPSYGHGTKGEPWKLEEHLDQLVTDCLALTENNPTFFLLTCHSPGHGPKQLRELIRSKLTHVTIESDPMILETKKGKQLRSGVACRIISPNV